MLLKIESKIINGTGLLKLSGVLDISTVEALHLSLGYFEGLSQLNIDFMNITFVDSTGINGIISSLQMLRKMKTKVLLQNIPDHILEILVILDVPETCGCEVFESLQGWSNLVAVESM